MGISRMRPLSRYDKFADAALGIVCITQEDCEELCLNFRLA